jgi:hypothetical protein
MMNSSYFILAISKSFSLWWKALTPFPYIPGRAISKIDTFFQAYNIRRVSPTTPHMNP